MYLMSGKRINQVEFTNYLDYDGYLLKNTEVAFISSDKYC